MITQGRPTLITGLSTDEKPVGTNGQLYKCMDTGDVFIFDAENAVWRDWYDKEGGGGVTPSGSVAISSNGTYDVTEVAEAVVSVPNPNSVVTVAGTLANPWGSYSFADLLTAYANHEISMYLETGGMTYVASPAGRATVKRRFVVVPTATATSLVCGEIDYTATGGYSAGRSYSVAGGGAATIIDMDSSDACTLTIVFHPLTGGLSSE